jgi:hypothetical protein
MHGLPFMWSLVKISRSLICLLQPPDHPVVWQLPKEINFLGGAHVVPNTPPLLKRMLYKISGLALYYKGYVRPNTNALASFLSFFPRR